jgi:hypothetical protein
MENKVTLEGIKSKIKAECYIVLPDGRTTICQLTLQNGYSVNGASACVDESNFDIGMGRKIAFDNALRKIWQLEGYLLADKLYWDRAVPVATNPPKKLVLNAQQVGVMKEAGFWKSEKKRDAVITKLKKAVAPWGLKKDGTPKQRPGRKTA